MKNLSLRSILLGGGIALFVPLICYFILKSKGHTGHIKVPEHYYVDSISPTGDSIYHTMDDNLFVTHLNDTVNLATDYKGKTLVINFLSTRGGDTSNKLAYHMGHLQNGFKLKKTDASVQIISISADKRDDRNKLRTFADKYTYDHDTWSFVKKLGAQDLAGFAQEELQLPKAAKLNNTTQHNYITLVDKYRNIRGYYNGMDSMEIKRCIDDIAIMMVEKNRIHEQKRK